uniref:Uncharacterized protein n=1 Tax=Aegilops tauschii subsp. strangulata TaxID=200361 RepID=A0A453EX64_AEGTS
PFPPLENFLCSPSLSPDPPTTPTRAAPPPPPRPRRLPSSDPRPGGDEPFRPHHHRPVRGEALARPPRPAARSSPPQGQGLRARPRISEHTRPGGAGGRWPAAPTAPAGVC